MKARHLHLGFRDVVLRPFAPGFFTASCEFDLERTQLTNCPLAASLTVSNACHRKYMHASV